MKKVFVGLNLGEFGHFLMHILPRLNGLYDKGYDITFATFEDDIKYIKKQVGPYILKHEITYPWWPSNRGVAKCDDIPNHIKELYRTINSTEYDLVIDTFNMSDEKFMSQIRSGPRIAKKITSKVHLEYKNSIIIFPRGGKNLWTEHKNWSEETCNLVIKHLAEKYSVYVGGVKGETRASVKLPNVYYLYEDTDRVNKTIDVLSNCVACITNVSGGSVLSLYIGCPTIAFGAKEYEKVYRYDMDGTKNYLETEALFSDSTELNNIIYDIDEFIDKSGNVRKALDFKVIE